MARAKPTNIELGMLDMMFDELMAMSDEELLAEAVEEYGSVEAAEREINNVRQKMLDAIKSHKPNPSKDKR